VGLFRSVDQQEEECERARGDRALLYAQAVNPAEDFFE
jgi:hypothetical protein